MKDTRKIKQLRSEINTLSIDCGKIFRETESKKTELREKNQRKRELQAELDKLTNKKTIRVSEHALLRYLERVKDINLEEIEAEIISEEVQAMVDTLGGNGNYPCRNYKVCLKNFVVTTVIL